MIKGKKGDDVIKGKKGDDIICGQRGDDRLFGGRGDDILIGGKGSDFLKGGAGQGPDLRRHPRREEQAARSVDICVFSRRGQDQQLQEARLAGRRSGGGTA